MSYQPVAVTLTLLLVATSCSSGDFEFDSLPCRSPIAAKGDWAPVPSLSLLLIFFSLSASVCCSVFLLFHSFWCCCFLAFIKGEESWCNFVFRHIQMQLYHSASGSIKGHFKIQLFFPPSCLLHFLPYNFFPLSLSQAHSFFHHSVTLSGTLLSPTFTPHHYPHTPFSYPLWYCWALAYVVEVAAGFWTVMDLV